MTASTVPSVNLACLTAQRSAAREVGEPSTPTTIRGAPFVLPADISSGPSAFFILYPKGQDLIGTRSQAAYSAGSDKGPVVSSLSPRDLATPSHGEVWVLHL